jgi:hypothetical protein
LVLDGHFETEIIGVTFSADGRTIFSHSKMGVVRAWSSDALHLGRVQSSKSAWLEIKKRVEEAKHRWFLPELVMEKLIAEHPGDGLRNLEVIWASRSMLNDDGGPPGSGWPRWEPDCQSLLDSVWETVNPDGDRVGDVGDAMYLAFRAQEFTKGADDWGRWLHVCGWAQHAFWTQGWQRYVEYSRESGGEVDRKHEEHAKQSLEYFSGQVSEWIDQEGDPSGELTRLKGALEAATTELFGDQE